MVRVGMVGSELVFSELKWTDKGMPNERCGAVWARGSS